MVSRKYDCNLGWQEAWRVFTLCQAGALCLVLSLLDQPLPALILRVGRVAFVNGC